MKGWWLAAAIGCLIGGCGTAAPSPSPESVTAQATPESKLRDQLSSGAFQLDAALESIAQALDSAKLLEKSLSSATQRSACHDVVDLLNGCGEGLAQFTDEPPPLEEVKGKFAAFDDDRLKAIEAANDCLHELNEALGILESLTEGASSEFMGSAASLQNRLVDAIDDVSGAITALGGTVEKDSDVEPDK